MANNSMAVITFEGEGFRGSLNQATFLALNPVSNRVFLDKDDA